MHAHAEVCMCRTQCSEADDRVLAAQSALRDAKLQYTSEKDSLWAEIRGLANQVQTSEERIRLRDTEASKLREDLIETIGKNKVLLDDFDLALAQRAAMEVGKVRSCLF